jgi:hypothetical protein
MAAVVPVSKGTTGYVPPGFIYANSTDANNLNGRVIGTAGLRLQRYFFADIDANEVWRSIPAGSVAFAIQANQNTGQYVAPLMANGNRHCLFSGGSNLNAYILVWSRGARAARSSGTDTTPVTKGTAGYMHPSNSVRRVLHDDGAVDPDTVVTATHGTVTTGPKSMAQRLRHRVYYFDAIDCTVPDEWTYSTSGRYADKIIEIAWQPAAGADITSPTLTATTVKFWGNAANTNGWLHVWST